MLRVVDRRVSQLPERVIGVHGTRHQCLAVGKDQLRVESATGGNRGPGEGLRQQGVLPGERLLRRRREDLRVRRGVRLEQQDRDPHQLLVTGVRGERGGQNPAQSFGADGPHRGALRLAVQRMGRPDLDITVRSLLGTDEPQPLGLFDSVDGGQVAQQRRRKRLGKCDEVEDVSHRPGLRTHSVGDEFAHRRCQDGGSGPDPDAAALPAQPIRRPFTLDEQPEEQCDTAGEFPEAAH